MITIEELAKSGLCPCKTCNKRNIRPRKPRILCVWCKKRIIRFKYESYKKEFLISGLCESCQDETFKRKRK